MNITVRLFATLREERFEEEVRHCDPRTTVRALVDDLAIPEEEVKLVFVNNRQAALDRELQDGDVVGIFPPIGGG